MGKLADGEGSGDQWTKESFGVTSGSLTSSDEQIANPVVYKLVRVEGDGSLVPATEDEVMEAENMFEEKKVKQSFIAGGLIEGGVLDEPSTTVEAKTKNSEGKLQFESTKVDADKFNARLEYIGVMLQKVKREEKLRLSSASLNRSSSCIIMDGQFSEQHDRYSAMEEKHSTNHTLQDPPLPLPILKDNRMTRLGSGVTCLKPTVGLVVGGSSASASYSSLMPDFSRIKGEICLDNLTVSDLQETFRATFGRETSVKDKLWLKRRIAMGLTNSCDVSTATFIIKDNVLVGKEVKKADCKMENSKNVYQINETGYHSCKDSLITPTVQVGDEQAVSCKRLRNPQVEYDCIEQQSAAKRVRKPTKRYIEELSDAETKECGGRSGSSINNSGHGQSSPKFRVMPIHDVTTEETASVTKQDSFGGSGVHVPHVSRVRRARPRENITSLVQYHPTSTDTIIKKALGDHISQQDSEIEDTNWKDRNSPKHIQPQVVAKTDQAKENVVKCLSEPKPLEKKQSFKYENLDSLGEDDSDYNIMSFANSKDGFRRKHHRPWSLGEVIKLVDGVSMFGAGRWSEIKKLSFASFSYRTSVDLKDKWRNLLRASFAQITSDNGTKKQGSVPIPAPILQRVRQLAETHSQPLPIQRLSVSKVPPVCYSGRSVNETRSAGYL